MNANLKDELDLIDNKKSSKSLLKTILLASSGLLILFLIFSSLSNRVDKNSLASQINIDELNNTINELDNTIDELNNTIIEKEKENLSLLKRITQLQEKTKSTELEIIGLNKEVTRLSNVLDDKDTVISQLKKNNLKSSVTVASTVKESIKNDLTIEETDLDNFDAWDAPPPPPSGPQVKFIPYDKAPVPLMPIRPRYPDIAQEAGIEGQVIVQCFIDKRGNVKETIVLKGIPNTGLNESAVEAIKKTKFRPAKQRQTAVGVWITIPVTFTLQY